MTMEYREAQKLLDRGLNRESRPIGQRRNTMLEQQPDGRIALTYRGKALVVIEPDGKYTLYTNGTRHEVIRARIEEFAPVKIKVRGGQWYIAVAGGSDVEWQEGITVDRKGNPIGVKAAGSGSQTTTRGTPPPSTPIAPEKGIQLAPESPELMMMTSPDKDHATHSSEDPLRKAIRDIVRDEVKSELKRRFRVD